MDGIQCVDAQLYWGSKREREIYIYFCIHTSRTAQNGGGTFKDKQPIGEIACFEARMAERTH